MFQITQYDHDAINDKLTIKVIFQLKTGGNTIEDGGTFFKKQSGDKWLREIKKNYLTIKIENFILHKKFIIESSTGHKSLNAKKIALDELERYLKYACKESSLIDVCKWCVQMWKQFDTILPNDKNNSFESSKTALAEIMTFANLHANGALLKNAY